MAEYYLAVDIGASSGRHILGCLEDGKLKLEEVYRFKNGVEERNGHLCWNLDRLFTEIKAGLKKCKEIGKIPVSMGIDTWGVDFVLLMHRIGCSVTRLPTATAAQKGCRRSGPDYLIRCALWQDGDPKTADIIRSISFMRSKRHSRNCLSRRKPG